MHEWALAEAVVAAASEIAEKEHLKEVAEVRIKVGELQQVDSEIFKFALEQLKTAKFKKAKFNIETARATLQCWSCNNKWFFSKEQLDQNVAEAIHFVPEIAHTYIKCPKCSSPDFEIVEGRGVWLESIRGAK
jgi:hydrogenase nickel incorporation protein HypA/HybF